MTIRAAVHFETTAATVSTCPRCRRPLLVGLSEGIPARVDVTPIQPAAEAQILAAGRQTYTLTRTGLVHRDDVRRTDPALGAPILAEHRCPGAA